jgi:hypothetical protein
LYPSLAKSDSRWKPVQTLKAKILWSLGRPQEARSSYPFTSEAK